MADVLSLDSIRYAQVEFWGLADVREAPRKKYACSNGILPDSVSTPPPQANGRFVAGIFRRKWANSLKRRF